MRSIKNEGYQGSIDLKWGCKKTESPFRALFLEEVRAAFFLEAACQWLQICTSTFWNSQKIKSIQNKSTGLVRNVFRQSRHIHRNNTLPFS